MWFLLWMLAVVKSSFLNHGLFVCNVKSVFPKGSIGVCGLLRLKKDEGIIL